MRTLQTLGRSGAPRANTDSAGEHIGLAPGHGAPGFTTRFALDEATPAEEEAAEFVYKALSTAARDVQNAHTRQRSPYVTSLNVVGRPLGGVGPASSAMPADPVMEAGVPIPQAIYPEKQVTE